MMFLSWMKRFFVILYAMLAPVYYRVYLYISFMMWTVHYYLHLGRYADLGHVLMNLVLLVCAYNGLQLLVSCYGYSRYYPASTFTAKVPEPVQDYKFLQTYLQDYMLSSTATYSGYCHYCAILRPPRSYHCRACETCVFRHEFHSNIVGTCIGLLNYKHFLGFLVTNILYVLLVTEGMFQALKSRDIDLPFKKVFGALIFFGFLNLCYLVPKLILMVLNMLRNESMHERNAINEFLRTGNRRHPIFTEGRMLDECWLTEVNGKWELVDNIDSKKFYNKSKKSVNQEKENTFRSRDTPECETPEHLMAASEKPPAKEKNSQSSIHSFSDPNSLAYDPINHPKLVYVNSRTPIRDRARLNPYNLGWAENCRQLLGDSIWQWFTIDVTCKGTGMEYPKNTADMIDDLEAFL